MNDQGSTEDPWLTLAEIAEELRVNPATVRLWVSRGRLEATRAGQRKLLVRRSELERMLKEANAPARRPAESASVTYGTGTPRDWREASPSSDPLSMPASRRLVAGPVGDALQAVREADQQWQAALDASADAPPDPGFAGRIRDIARGCDAEAAAFEKAIAARLGWQPLETVPETFALSHELRPGANRPGPRDLWERFDCDVRALASAMSTPDIRAVGAAFGALGATLHEIADALESDVEGDRRRAS